MVRELEPHSRLAAVSRELVLDPLSPPPLSAPPSLSLSKIKISMKEKENLTLTSSLVISC